MPPPASPPKPAKLLSQLDACMLSDQPRLTRRVRGIQRAIKQGRDSGKALSEVQAAVQRSTERRAQRQQRLPQPAFDPALPVCERQAEIADAIRQHPVVIIAGATGSGKTTQLPKICLALGRGAGGMIGCTQPRRIAAISVAGRVADELASGGSGEVGGLVGYKTRFGARHSPDNLVRFMTDGILLAETQGDRQLRAYDTLIIDEVHERSLNIDLLLGYLKQLLKRRPELKLIISSATLDTQRLSKFFDAAPVIEVEGRTYPVETRYQPPQRERELAEAVADSVSDIARADRSGDILVFFSGEREIREAADALARRQLPHNEVLPLFGRLSQAEQKRVFRNSSRQKVILATNVAETSLTIPGIRYVIDTGLARIHRYSHRSQVSRLQVEPVSQASCNQRAGRSGRIGPGICIRLYEEKDFAQRPEFTDPEIQRSSLAEVILRMESLGLSEVERFPFVDPPPPKAIKEGYRVLEELGALAAAHNQGSGLSDIGRQLARLPLDPRLGRMLVAANQNGCLQEVLAITAGLSIQDPRERPLDKQQTADQRHQAFADPQSDFLSLLNLWRAFLQQRSEGASRSAQRRWCKQNFLSYNRMLEWRDTQQQLEGVARQLDFKCSNPEADYAVIHCALMTGLLSRIGQLHEKNVYLGARQLHFHPFPGSVLFRKNPKWVMAGELVDTSRLYGRTLARIDVDWIEPLAGHLLRRSYSDPHWEKKRSQVVAFENVTLLGLPIVNRRKTAYGRIDPKEAREIFIREGLVRGELNTHGKFMAHNQALMAEVEGLEERARRRDILVDEETMAAFYEPLIPAEVNDGRRFERWRKLAEREHPQLLFMQREALMQHNAETITRERFPSDIALQGGKLLLDYRFEPGKQDDGVNIDIPLARLAQLKPQQFEWLVPGLRQELFEALLRGLPKSLRRNFVPVPDYARRAVAELSPEDGPLLPTLSHWLLRVSGVTVKPEDWSSDKLPEHLRVNYRVVDKGGKAVEQGRDLDALQSALAERARSDFGRLPQGDWQRDKVLAWDFGDLPEQVSIGSGRHAVLGFPSLVDHGDHVALTLLHEPEQARRQHHAGVRRLLALQLGKTYRQLGKSLPLDGATTLAYAHFGNSTALRRHVVDAAIERVCLAGRGPVRSQQDFEQRLQQGRGKLTATTTAVWNQLSPLLISRQQLAAQLQQAPSSYTAAAIKDLRTQLDWLFPAGFLLSVPDARLGHYRRYLKAISRRLDGLRNEPGRDAPRLAELAPFWRAVTDRIGKPGTPIDDPVLEQLRWMVEEFRVSLFAQELGTAQPASAKRLGKLLDKLAPQ